MDDKESAVAFQARTAASLSVEREIQGHEQWPGMCAVCGTPSHFTVYTGALFDGRPNLREGLRCEACRLTARQRTMLCAMRETLTDGRRKRGAILEGLSTLYRRVKSEYPKAIGSEFISSDRIPGRRYLWRSPGIPWMPRVLRHESVTDLSHADASLDYIVHADVLEHVFDTRKALQECRRVLVEGGAMIFTAPFFPHLEETVVRGRIDADGRLTELLPSEYHGDGLNPRGVYTFYNFGWSLFEMMRGMFARVQIGLLHDPAQGFVCADSVAGPWNMPPIVFRAFR